MAAGLLCSWALQLLKLGSWVHHGDSLEAGAHYIEVGSIWDVSPLAAITPRHEQGAGSLQQASLSSYPQCGACQGSVGAFYKPTLIICNQGVCCGHSEAWSEDAVTSVAIVVSTSDVTQCVLLLSHWSTWFSFCVTRSPQEWSLAYFRHQGEEVPKRKAGVKLGPMSSETQGTILQPGLHGRGNEEIVRTRHEEGDVLPGAPCFLPWGSPVLSEFVGGEAWDWQPQKMVRPPALAGQVKSQVIMKRCSRGERRKQFQPSLSLSLSLGPWHGIYFLVEGRRFVWLCSAGQAAVSPTFDTSLLQRVLQGSDQNCACDSSSWLAPGVSFFLSPREVPPGKFVFWVGLLNW